MKFEELVLKYKKTYNYEMKNELKTVIYKDMSSMKMSEKDFMKQIENGSFQYVKKKISISEKDKKHIYSDAIRSDIAELVAEILSTKKFDLEGNKAINTLLDYSCTEKAEEKNRIINDTFINGSVKEKSRLFNTLTNPILEVNHDIFYGKTDERLILEWREIATKLYKCTVLRQMIQEAKHLGIVVSEEREKAFNIIQKRSEIPYKILSGRAAIMANPYYCRINADDLLKLNPEKLKSLSVNDEKLQDYLNDICEVSESYKDNIKEQVRHSLKNMGYTAINQVRFGDKNGNDYEKKEIMSVLLNGKPIYILSEEGKLQHALHISDRNGFINPTSDEYMRLNDKKLNNDVKKSVIENNTVVSVNML